MRLMVSEESVHGQLLQHRNSTMGGMGIKVAHLSGN